MNLLLINYEYPPIGGGAGTATWNMSRELVQQGHYVVVVTANYQNLRGWSDEEGVKVYRCRALRKSPDRSSLLEQFSFVVSAAVVLPKILKQYPIEGVIVFFSLPCGPLGLWCKILKGIPYIVSLRAGDVPGLALSINWLHNVLTPLRRLVLNHAYTTVANSEGLKQVAQKADLFPVKVIPNGVDTRFFSPIDYSSNDVFQFLFVGRFHQQKNLFFLLEQLNLLKNTSKSLPFKCHFIGDGHLKETLQAYAKKLGLASIIIWYGWLNKVELRYRYQRANCFLNLSLYEGMPNAVLEAMACGLPIIASNVIGNRELVQQGKTGYLVDLENSLQLQEIFLYVLNNQEEVKQLGRAGRERVVKEFSWERVAREYVELF